VKAFALLTAAVVAVIGAGIGAIDAAGDSGVPSGVVRGRMLVCVSSVVCVPIRGEVELVNERTGAVFSSGLDAKGDYSLTVSPGTYEPILIPRCRGLPLRFSPLVVTAGAVVEQGYASRPLCPTRAR